MTDKFTDSYVEMFISSAYSAEGMLSVFALLFLFMARMLPIIGLSPFLGSRILPNPVKIALAFSLFVIFLPQLLFVTTKPLLFNTELIFYALKELFVGYVIGFVMGTLFTIVQATGMIIDHQRGGASLMVNDPTIQNQSSPIGTLLNMFLIVLFFMINGPFYFFEAIAESYRVIPPDQFINPGFFNKEAPFWQMQIQLFNEVMRLTIQLSSPALIAILMTDMFLGIANRLAPQVQITFLGMPLKSLLGLTVICFGWNLMTSELAKQSFLWLNKIQLMIQEMHS